MIDGRLARRFPLVAFAKRNLSRARARTILAMAGITIGVVAIASLGMFGAAFEQSFFNSVDDTTRTVMVGPGEDADFETLDRDRISLIRRHADAPVYPQYTTSATIQGLKERTGGQVIAIDDPGEFVDARQGRIPPDWRSGALVGDGLASDLGVGVGDSVSVDGDTYRVVAVLEPDNPRSGLLNTDDAVLLPREQVAPDRATRVFVKTETPEAAFNTAAELRSALNGRDQRYQVWDAESAIEQIQNQLSTINTFLLGIGAVSLLVAAVSILNVMLMSTIERREEIGVLRAVGYRRLDILRLMLVEAALLGVVGALAGVTLSVLLGMAINAELLSDPMAFTSEAVLYLGLGFLFGTGASFLSGLYPAWKAANARPVEALRD